MRVLFLWAGDVVRQAVPHKKTEQDEGTNKMANYADWDAETEELYQQFKQEYNAAWNVHVEKMRKNSIGNMLHDSADVIVAGVLLDYKGFAKAYYALGSKIVDSTRYAFQRQGTINSLEKEYEQSYDVFAERWQEETGVDRSIVGQLRSVFLNDYCKVDE